MDNKPLVSVIITLYNYEQFICECLESVRLQTFKGWEVIVVDDCSTDDGVNRAAAYIAAHKMNGWVEALPKNMGYSHAKNVGIQKASGKYVSFIDADDRFTPTSLMDRLQTFCEKPGLEFVHGVALRWYGKDDTRGHNPKTYCHAQGRLYLRSLHERFGLYYEPLRSMADKEWVYRLGIHPDSPLPKLVAEKRIKKEVALYRKHSPEVQMHKWRKLHPKVNKKIIKIFTRRIKQLKREGITKKNTLFL